MSDFRIYSKWGATGPLPPVSYGYNYISQRNEIQTYSYRVEYVVVQLNLAYSTS